MSHECTCGAMLGNIVEVVMHYTSRGCGGRFTATSLSSGERSTLLYVESRVVDHGGALEPVRMNHIDTQNLKLFAAADILEVTDNPSGDVRQVTSFTGKAWELAHECRKYRADGFCQGKFD